MRDLDRLRLLDRVRAKRAPLTRVVKGADTFLPAPLNPSAAPSAMDGQAPTSGLKASRLDDAFFEDERRRIMVSDRPTVMGVAANSVANGNTARVSLAAKASELSVNGDGKKHFKANRRHKQRSGAGYD